MADDAPTRARKAKRGADTLSVQAEVHDRHQLELRFNYAIGESGRRRYHVDAWFFVPRNVGLHRGNYTKEQFYADFTAYMRIDAGALCFVRQVDGMPRVVGSRTGNHGLFAQLLLHLCPEPVLLLVREEWRFAGGPYDHDTVVAAAHEVRREAAGMGVIHFAVRGVGGDHRGQQASEFRHGVGLLAEVSGYCRLRRDRLSMETIEPRH